MTVLQTAVWFLVAYVSGSLPFSVWVGKLAMGKDIRQYGDKNPGAFNVFRAGGRGWGWLAILLDGLKGAIPVAIANFGWRLDGWALVAIALAPVLGHAYSPLLGFRGGKALAVTFGIWTGLTLWVAPTILGVFFAVFIFFLKKDIWGVVLGQSGLGIALLMMGADWTWLAVWGGSTVVFVLKYFLTK